MGINEEQLRARWRAELARIAAQIDDLRGRIGAESRQLEANLAARLDALQAELEKLEHEVEADDADAHVRQIAVQIAELSAKGEAAYQRLQTELAVSLDPTEAEIRRLEAIAATGSAAVRANLMARIEALQARRAGEQANTHDDRARQGGDAAP